MEVVDDLGEIFLGLVLPGDIGKLDALGRFDIDLGIGFPHVEHHGIAAAHLFHQLAREDLSQDHKKDQGQDPAQDAHQEGGLLDLLPGGGDPGIQKPLDELRVGNHSRFVDGLFVFVGEEDAVALFLELHLADLALLGHGDKGIVVHILDPVL